MLKYVTYQYILHLISYYQKFCTLGELPMPNIHCHPGGSKMTVQSSSHWPLALILHIQSNQIKQQMSILQSRF